MTDSASRRIWEFDYLKFIGIISVIITHSDFTTEHRELFIFPYFIDMAVPVFMIITGYMNSLSCQKRQIKSISEYFKRGGVLKRINYILLPLLIIYLAEIIIYATYYNENITIPFLIELIRYDNMGPGSYYPIVLIQIYLIFPFMYVLFNKSPAISSVLIVLVEIIYEIIKNVSEMDEDIYRVVGIRYIVCILLGMVLFRYKEKLKLKRFYILSIPSALYIYLISYTDYELQVFNSWISTSMPTNLWAFTLVLLGLNCFKRLPRFIDRAVNKIGSSTYFIFLVQMMWFSFAPDKNIENLALAFLLNLFVSLFGGLLFEYVYQYIESLIMRKIKKVGA